MIATYGDKNGTVLIEVDSCGYLNEVKALTIHPVFYNLQSSIIFSEVTDARFKEIMDSVDHGRVINLTGLEYKFMIDGVQSQ